MAVRKPRIIKREIRVIGFDDAPFDKDNDKTVLVVGAVFRGGYRLEGVLSTKIDVDGINSTQKLTEIVNKSKHKGQLQIIMLDGIAFGGFNVVDINKLSKDTGLPVITTMRTYPDFDKIKLALRNVKEPEKRFELMQKAGDIHEINLDDKKIYIQKANIELEDVIKILKIACTRSFMPEAVRAAHLIASGIVIGESRGRV